MSTEKNFDRDPQAEVRRRLREAILGGDFAPRQRLIEAELCERFGASRFQVRSALQELASQGLVEFQRNRGARVRHVSLAETIEITEVRMLLEGHAAARAAERVSASQAQQLRRIAKEMRIAVTGGELMRYSTLNAELHSMLRDISAQSISAQLLEQLRGQTVRHQFTLSLVPGRSAISLPQHEAIVDAVCRRDPVAAQAAMHAHLQSVIDAFASIADPSSA